MAIMQAYQIIYQDGHTGPEVKCGSPFTAYRDTKDVPGVSRVQFITNQGIL